MVRKLGVLHAKCVQLALKCISQHRAIVFHPLTQIPKILLYSIILNGLPSYCFILTPFVCVSQDTQLIHHFYDTILRTLHFAMCPKGKREADLIPLLSVLLHKSFKREEKYVTLQLWLRGINYVQHIQA